MSEQQPGRTDRQRLDTWLWHARVVRTRSLAQKLACDGYVRVNGVRAEQSSKLVHVGDVLTVALQRDVRVLEIRALSDRRRSADQAKIMFEDLKAGKNQADCDL